jgi:hypothetical protein
VVFRCGIRGLVFELIVARSIEDFGSRVWDQSARDPGFAKDAWYRSGQK